jgi:hypothetical protein
MRRGHAPMTPADLAVARAAFPVPTGRKTVAKRAAARRITRR